MGNITFLDFGGTPESVIDILNDKIPQTATPK